jgi:hypothetical protein
MREKNFNTGLRGVLFEERHYARMGSAIWLYGWLVLRQTHQTGATGWVLGGAPVSYREIEGETGFNRRTLERWMSLLRRNEYIATEAAPGGVIVRILKAKKHLQGPRLGHANDVHAVRKLAETVRRVAERSTRSCVANCGERHKDQQNTSGIGSSVVVRIKDKEQKDVHRAVEIAASLPSEKTRAFRTSSQNDLAEEIQQCERREFQQQFRNVVQNHDLKNSCSEKNNSTGQTQPHNQRGIQQGNQPHSNDPFEKQNPRPADSHATRTTTQQNFPWQLRERIRLQRAERDEAVRRELAVGTGPEVRRP